MEKKITALETQKNNPDRMNVYLDEKFAFGISRFVGAWLSVGQIIDEIKIKALIQDDDKERAFQSSLRYIAYKQRTETEVVKKLEKLEFSPEIIDNVMCDLREKRYVNDNEFADQWIEIRGDSKLCSKKFLEIELRNKGIPDDIVKAALEKAPDDIETAIKLGKKYINRFVTADDKDFRKKMTGILLRRAFSYSVVKDTINELIKLRIKDLKQ
jgi:regulatory protein